MTQTDTLPVVPDIDKILADKHKEWQEQLLSSIGLCYNIAMKLKNNSLINIYSSLFNDIRDYIDKGAKLAKIDDEVMPNPDNYYIVLKSLTSFLKIVKNSKLQIKVHKALDIIENDL